MKIAKGVIDLEIGQCYYVSENDKYAIVKYLDSVDLYDSGGVDPDRISGPYVSDMNGYLQYSQQGKSRGLWVTGRYYRLATNAERMMLDICSKTTYGGQYDVSINLIDVKQMMYDGLIDSVLEDGI